MDVIAKTDQRVGVCKIVYKKELLLDSSSANCIDELGSISSLFVIVLPAVAVGSHDGEDREIRFGEIYVADKGGAKALTLVATSEHNTLAVAMKR